MVRSDQVQMPANVYNLLKAVREEAKRVLNGLDVGDLRLFPSHGDWSASQAHLGMATSVDEITGGTADKPLFVHNERQQAPEQATHSKTFIFPCVSFGELPANPHHLVPLGSSR